MEENPNENIPRKAPLANMHPAVFIVIVLFTTFITYQVFGGLLTVIIVGAKVEKFTENLSTTRIILSFAQFMFLLFPALILSMMRGNNFRDTFRVKKPDLVIFFLSVFGLVLVQPFLQAYLVIQNKLIFSLPFGTEAIKQVKDLFDSLEQTTMSLVTAHSIPEFIFVIFVIAVTPAICEEFLFRGIVFRNFEKVSLRRNAMFLTGLLFALFHFHPFNLIPLILLGFYLTFITYYSGSIFTAVACHFLNNFISAFSVFIFGKENFAEPDISGMQLMQFGLLGLLSIVLFVFLLVYIVRLYNKKSQIVV
ncbi:MAG: CPBP family intramembrane metalloprotease [Ignavibacteriae bacterium]|nr:CPBP family intramembrane metalloprotease [Ignavibacteriota bacterium]